MKKAIVYILVFISLSANAQVVNRFRDSTWFAKGVRFDVPPYLIQGAGSGKVITSDNNGRMTWQTFTASGVTQQALNDSIARLDSSINAIPSPDLQQVTDVGYETTNEIKILVGNKSRRFILLDNNGAGASLEYDGIDPKITLSNPDEISSAIILIQNLTGDRIIQIPDSNGILAMSVNGVKADSYGDILINYVNSDSLAQIRQEITDTATQIRSEIPDVSNLATVSNLADTATLLRSLIPATPTFTILKNSAKDSIVTVFNGTRSAVKDSVANLTNYVTNTKLTDSLSTKTNKLISFSSYTTSDTLRLTDADKVIEMNVGSANNLVIPTNTAYSFPVGTQIVLIQIGAGQTTLVPASGVTVTSEGSKLKLSGIGAMATLIKRSTNAWYLGGSLAN